MSADSRRVRERTDVRKNFLIDVDDPAGQLEKEPTDALTYQHYLQSRFFAANLRASASRKDVVFDDRHWAMFVSDDSPTKTTPASFTPSRPAKMASLKAKVTGADNKRARSTPLMSLPRTIGRNTRQTRKKFIEDVKGMANKAKAFKLNSSITNPEDPLSKIIPQRHPTQQRLRILYYLNTWLQLRLDTTPLSIPPEFTDLIDVQAEEEDTKDMILFREFYKTSFSKDPANDAIREFSSKPRALWQGRTKDGVILRINYTYKPTITYDVANGRVVIFGTFTFDATTAVPTIFTMNGDKFQLEFPPYGNYSSTTRVIRAVDDVPLETDKDIIRDVISGTRESQRYHVQTQTAPSLTSFDKQRILWKDCLSESRQAQRLKTYTQSFFEVLSYPAWTAQIEHEVAHRLHIWTCVLDKALDNDLEGQLGLVKHTDVAKGLPFRSLTPKQQEEEGITPNLFVVGETGSEQQITQLAWHLAIQLMQTKNPNTRATNVVVALNLVSQREKPADIKTGIAHYEVNDPDTSPLTKVLHLLFIGLLAGTNLEYENKLKHALTLLDFQDLKRESLCAISSILEFANIATPFDYLPIHTEDWDANTAQRRARELWTARQEQQILIIDNGHRIPLPTTQIKFGDKTLDFSCDGKNLKCSYKGAGGRQVTSTVHLADNKHMDENYWFVWVKSETLVAIHKQNTKPHALLNSKALYISNGDVFDVIQTVPETWVDCGQILAVVEKNYRQFIFGVLHQDLVLLPINSSQTGRSVVAKSVFPIHYKEGMQQTISEWRLGWDKTPRLDTSCYLHHTPWTPALFSEGLMRSNQMHATPLIDMDWESKTNWISKTKMPDVQRLVRKIQGLDSKGSKSSHTCWTTVPDIPDKIQKFLQSRSGCQTVIEATEDIESLDKIVIAAIADVRGRAARTMISPTSLFAFLAWMPTDKIADRDAYNTRRQQMIDFAQQLYEVNYYTQVKRAITNVKTYMENTNKKPPTCEVLTRFFSSVDLANASKTKRTLPMMVIELANEMILRHGQGLLINEVLSDLDDRKKRIHKAVMGIGKTSLVGPIACVFCLLHPDIDYTFFVQPKHLVPSTSAALSELLRAYVPESAVEKLESIEDAKKLQGALKKKVVYVMSDTSAKMLLYKKCVVRDVEYDAHKTAAIFDEFDLMYNPAKSELNKVEQQVPGHPYLQTERKTDRAPDFATFNRHYFQIVTSTLQHIEKNDWVAKYERGELKSPDSEVRKYLTVEADKYTHLSDAKFRNTLADTISYVVFKMQPYVNYMLHDSSFLAVPGKGLLDPAVGSQHMNIDIIIVATIAAVRIEKKISRPAMEELFKFYSILPADEVPAFMSGPANNQFNQYWKNPKERINVDTFIKLLEEDTDVRLFCSNLWIQDFLMGGGDGSQGRQHITTAKVTHSINFLHLTSNLFAARASAFTGTTSITTLELNEGFQPILDKASDLNSKEAEQTDLAVESVARGLVICKKEEDQDEVYPIARGLDITAFIVALTTVIEKHDALIDECAMLRKLQDFPVDIIVPDNSLRLKMTTLPSNAVRLIIKVLLQKGTKKQVIFYDKEDVLWSWNISTGIATKLLDQSPLEYNKDYFLFYDHKHKVGSDILQSPELTGVVLTDTNTTYDSFAQAMYRLRQLNISQRVSILYEEPPASKKPYATDLKRRQELIDLFKKNQEALKMSTNLKLHQHVCQYYMVLSNSAEAENWRAPTYYPPKLAVGETQVDVLEKLMDSKMREQRADDLQKMRSLLEPETSVSVDTGEAIAEQQSVSVVQAEQVLFSVRPSLPPFTYSRILDPLMPRMIADYLECKGALELRRGMLSISAMAAMPPDQKQKPTYMYLTKQSRNDKLKRCVLITSAEALCLLPLLSSHRAKSKRYNLIAVQSWRSLWPERIPEGMEWQRAIGRLFSRHKLSYDEQIESVCAYTAGVVTFRKLQPYLSKIEHTSPRQERSNFIEQILTSTDPDKTLKSMLEKQAEYIKVFQREGLQPSLQKKLWLNFCAKVNGYSRTFATT